MNISDLFKRLSLGPLSNLSITNEGSGGIIVAKHPQMIQYANEALLRLFSRFRLLEKDVLVQMEENVTNYHLKPEFTESSGKEGNPLYIKDLGGEPFEGDVIQILEVYDAWGRKMTLNDADRPSSLFTPQHDVLQVPALSAGEALAIHYQARHPVLLDQGDEYLLQKIVIPFSLEGALIKHIAYQTYNDMNGPENIMKGQEYLASYDAICMEVADRDLINQTFATSHHKLEMRGFV
jgi:hypothetical protein